MKQIYSNRERGAGADPGVEFAKHCQKNNGLADPSLITCPEAHIDNNYVVINRALQLSQVESLSSVFKDFAFTINQMYFSNN